MSLTADSPVRRPRRGRLARRRRLAGFLLSIPAIVLVAALLWAPILQAVRYSMTSWNGYSAPVWIGPSAYTTAFGDPIVRRVLENNALLLLAVPIRHRDPADHRGAAARARPRLAVLQVYLLPAHGDLLGRHRYGRAAVLCGQGHPEPVAR